MRVSQIRLDRITQVVRNVVDPRTLGDVVAHYSIPAFDALGGPVEDLTADIESNKLLLHGGEVLISKLNPRKSRVVIVKPLSLPIVGSTEFIALNPTGVDPRWLCYWLRSDRVQQELMSRVQSVTRSQQRVEARDLCRLWLELPSLGGQRAIADFLDAETARLAAVFERRERQIQLVQEKASAAIVRATRHGIRDAELRPSGVAWLGPIAKHWSVQSLKRIGTLAAGAAFPDAEQGQTDLAIPYFKVSDLNDPGNSVELNHSEHSVTEETRSRLGAPRIPPGSVVFPKIGAALLSNRRRITTRTCCTDQNLMAFTVTRGSARFYLYALQPLDFYRLSKSGPVPLLNEADAAKILIAVPPADEQIEIAAYLDGVTASASQVIARMRSQIEPLRERRQALITGAVTGQIRIPGAL